MVSWPVVPGDVSTNRGPTSESYRHRPGDGTVSVERAAEVEETDPFENRFSLRAGAIAGFVATAVTGVLITVAGLPTLRVAVAGLYGQAGNPVAGWIAHLVHGTLFGVVFAVVLTDPAFHRLTESTVKTALTGAVYGVVLAVFAAGMIMPIWLGVVGLTSAPEMLHITPSSVAWHLSYGLVLGGLYATLERRRVRGVSPEGE